MLEQNATNITREAGYDMAGTLPTQIGYLTSLRVLDLTVVQGPLRRSRARSLHDARSLQLSLVGGSGISGTLPSQLGLLRSLRVLRLGPMGDDCSSANAVGGTIPIEIVQLPFLRELDLRCNKLTYPESEAMAGFEPYRAMQARCDSQEDLCQGFPPESCLALYVPPLCRHNAHHPLPTLHFNPPTPPPHIHILLRLAVPTHPHALRLAVPTHPDACSLPCVPSAMPCRAHPPTRLLRAVRALSDAVPSLTNVRLCTPCEDVPFGWLVFGAVAILIFSAAGLGLYISLMLKHPQALRRWGSTVEIILSHTRTMVILSHLQVAWPQSVQAILAGPDLTLLPNLFNLPSAACFVDVGNSPFWPFVNGILWSALAGFGALLLIQHVAFKRDPADAERLEYVIALCFGIQLPKLLAMGLSVILEAEPALRRRSSYTAALLAVIGSGTLFVLDAYLLSRFYGNLLAYRRGQIYHDWRPWRWVPDWHRFPEQAQARIRALRRRSRAATRPTPATAAASSQASQGPMKVIDVAWDPNGMEREPVGIEIEASTALEGALVTRVTKHGCGLVAGDTIVELDGVNIRDFGTRPTPHPPSPRALPLRMHARALRTRSTPHAHTHMHAHAHAHSRSHTHAHSHTPLAPAMPLCALHAPD